MGAGRCLRLRIGGPVPGRAAGSPAPSQICVDSRCGAAACRTARLDAGDPMSLAQDLAAVAWLWPDLAADCAGSQTPEHNSGVALAVDGP